MVFDTSLLPTRRQMIAAGVSITLFPFPAVARSRPLRISLLGQALIKTDLRLPGWPALRSFKRLLKSSDVVFTDLETVISGPLAGKSTRPADSDVLHVGFPEVIDCLKAIGVNIVATSNNHAWDLDTGGILSTIDAVKTRGLSFAGSGADLASAGGPGYLLGRNTVALVAAAAGAIRDGAAATADRPGVNELRRDADGRLNAVDVERYLAAIRLAASTGAIVIAYLHSHYWEPKKSDTPAWQRDLARRTIDAGAVTFAAHGVPELQGIEYYRGAPLFHGLSSFIFQSKKPDGAYGPEAWQSIIAQIEIDRGVASRTKIIPVQLDASGVTHDGSLIRGTPKVADAGQAVSIIERITTLSSALGNSVSFGPTTLSGKPVLHTSVQLDPT